MSSAGKSSPSFAWAERHQRIWGAEPQAVTFESLLILFVGFVAGNVNTVVGSGSLVTFPTLIALGYPPLIANVTNTIGLAPGSVSGSVGYRRELTGQRSRAARLG